jgi:hypothetical protein
MPTSFHVITPRPWFLIYHNQWAILLDWQMLVNKMWKTRQPAVTDWLVTMFHGCSIAHPGDRG